MLTSDIPDAGDGVAVLALTESGATTAVIEVDKGINTLVITTSQARHRASKETLRARGDVTGTVFTPLDIHALAMTVSALATIVLVTIITRVSGGLRWSRGFGGGGSGWGGFAAEGTRVPVRIPGALRRRKLLRRLGRSTAALSSVPIPVEGAVSARRRGRGVTWSSIGKTDIFGWPPKKLRFSTIFPVSTQRTHMNWSLLQPSPLARTKGTAKAKRTTRAMSDISMTQTKDGVGIESEGPGTEKRRE